MRPGFKSLSFPSVDLYFSEQEAGDTGMRDEIFVGQERGCDGESLSRKCVTVGGRPVQKIDAWVVKVSVSTGLTTSSSCRY